MVKAPDIRNASCPARSQPPLLGAQCSAHPQPCHPEELVDCAYPEPRSPTRDLVPVTAVPLLNRYRR